MRIHVADKADWISANGRQHVSLPAGDHTVRREVGDDLVAKGQAVEVKPPSKKDAD